MNTIDDYEPLSDINIEAISEKLSSLSISHNPINSVKFKNKFDIEKELYKSPNSSVYLTNFHKRGALKLVFGQTHTSLLEKEFKVLSSLEHPNIIKPFSHETGFKHDGTIASYLFVPYYKNGEMFDYVKDKGGLGEHKSVFYFTQI